MVLTSVIYLSFLVGLLFLYYIVPGKAQWLVLLAASIIFIGYGINNPMMVFLIIYGIIVTYFGAIFIEKQTSEKKKNIIKIVTIVLILLELIALKYLSFIGMLLGNIGIKINENTVKNISMLAPLGISFYSLISIGYILDVSRGLAKSQRNILKHSLFILFFPQLTSGPITRYPEMKEMLFRKHELKFQNIYFGFQRILWGFFKKLVISERMALVVNTVFNNYASYSGLYVILATVAFAIQLYTDFSGCMDIVIGTSEMFGIVLPENFDTPYFSRSISEYWRRWHISLGNWFKDYYFYPILKSNFIQNMHKKLKPKLGKKWSKKIPTYIGMLILWTTIGLWHGGNYTYLIGSGLLHWFYIVFGEVCSPLFKKIAGLFRLKDDSVILKLIQIARTFILVCIGFVFFRSNTVSQAVKMLGSIPKLNLNIKVFSLGLNKDESIIAVISVLVLFVVSLLKQKIDIRKFVSKRNIIFRFAIWIVLISTILVFGYYGTGYDSQAFIYQRF